ncbi:MAG: efflux RND transporter periplasmic adaptor subunit, partial [Bacteroidota bacterium]
LAFAVKEKDIILEQSKYEPPATIRQAEIDKEKANRNYQQAKQNYLLKKKQAGARMQNMSVSLSQEQDGLKQAQQVLGQFQILAPEDGMVIYVRDWWGNKQTVGSVINIWGDPAIASLPDLSVMISRTYVNEVDIRKIKQGQNVKIGLDAFPEKKMTGKVVTVANVGEQRPNSDAKVFEVSIQVSEKDTTLRPAMTTSNNIVATVLKDVLYVPLEALHSQGDSITYVFKKEGTSFIKQQVKVGQNNDNEAVILEGVKKEDFVFLSVPGKADDRTIVLLPSQARTPKKPASTLSVRK